MYNAKCKKLHKLPKQAITNKTTVYLIIELIPTVDAFLAVLVCLGNLTYVIVTLGRYDHKATSSPVLVENSTNSPGVY